ncbi:dihydrofolate reductase family protein [uncultured Psychroserpens sp.]|uniref:dihydrofolate reductase family protein n=1 Tax=uncultured Psychroserpens sp. TaxID=255436 RepID=UPI00262FF260|nr:dihydrofolate reductase family protein [uncultured Psychroserpens sp.]
MRKLALLTFITLDGVMQAPKLPEEDTSNDFKLGGWADKYWDEVMEQVKSEAMSEPYDLLLGRKTYDIFASAHKSNMNGNSDESPMDKATKYVVTNSDNKLEWKNSIAITGNVAEEISKLKSQDGLLLQVHGSWDLIQTLLLNDLVDEFRIWTFPVVLGKGKRLFSKDFVPKNLTLVKSESTSNGVVMSIYKCEQITGYNNVNS